MLCMPCRGIWLLWPYYCNDLLWLVLMGSDPLWSTMTFWQWSEINEMTSCNALLVMTGNEETGSRLTFRQWALSMTPLTTIGYKLTFWQWPSVLGTDRLSMTAPRGNETSYDWLTMTGLLWPSCNDRLIMIDYQLVCLVAGRGYRF